jgi:hypothetical protein
MSKQPSPILRSAIVAGALTLLTPLVVPAANNQILGWNNLGMHCMDSDYSVFSILPPYNTIECQLIVGGKLVTNGVGYAVTYRAVADPSGSTNSTAMGKGNFYTYSGALYGATPVPEMGLAGWAMPGTNNVPQGMLFEQTNHPAAGVATPVNWWRAEGIPISPYDDAHQKNPYPLMRIIAHSGATPIATNDVVLPVSDEMDCRACHASGSYTNTLPAAGWVWNSNAELDYRLNILRLHDEKQFARHSVLYSNALAARGFNGQGLYQGVVADGKPALCAACHASEALGAPSYGSIPPLTASVHGQHAMAKDPTLLITLDNSANRAACYRCHPGSTTRCLRGAMGSAIAADGSMEMQCQSCHGNMSTVGSTNRVGWFMEPACQSCHSGTAAHNNGQIRYTSVFTDTNFTVRVAMDQTFATQPNIPAPGISLYRFSAGHGGLQCSACHGSTHAESPSTHGNDNLRNLALQGYAGTMVECTACHTAMPNTPNGGPHGLHAIGQGWVSGSETGTNIVTKHADRIGSLPGGVAACQPCHGMDYRGTVLSRAQTDRTLTASFDSGSITVQLFRGAVMGCYNCHNGPANDHLNSSTPPAVSNVSTNTSSATPVAMVLPATGSGLTLRIISQPANGSVGLNTNTHVATYFPNPGFIGTDTFTFAAYNGAKNSTLGTGTVAVAPGTLSITAQPAGRTNNVGTTATFGVTVTGTAPLRYQWRKNGTNSLTDGGRVSGATTATLTLSSITPNDAGSYSVVVTNVAGSATSSNAVLTVIEPPTIVSQPANRTNTAGTTASFSVTAGGTAPLSYRWKQNGTNLFDGGRIFGAATATLMIASLGQSDAATYTVAVTNGAGYAVSDPATLTVWFPPSITSQPASRTNIAGTEAAFWVTATGTEPLSYQWRKNGTNLFDGSLVSGTTTAQLTVASVAQSDAATYTVAIINGAGFAVSDPAILTVIDPPVITAQPADATNNTGTTATFTVAVSGTAPFSYRWRKSASDLTDGGKVSGATAATLTLSSILRTDAGSYSVMVTNAAGSATSSNAVLTVVPMLYFDTSPAGLKQTTSGLELTVIDLLGRGPVTVYVTTNWLSWQVLLTNPPVTGALQVIDPGVTNSRRRFYRASEQW